MVKFSCTTTSCCWKDSASDRMNATKKVDTATALSISRNAYNFTVTSVSDQFFSATDKESSFLIVQPSASSTSSLSWKCALSRILSKLCVTSKTIPTISLSVTTHPRRTDSIHNITSRRSYLARSGGSSSSQELARSSSSKSITVSTSQVYLSPLWCIIHHHMDICWCIIGRYLGR